MERNANDIALALEIHQRLNAIGVTENAVIPPTSRDSYVPRSLVDDTLELIDPTPNIHTLFVQFNAKYFWNKLLPVEVKWSNRMTSCAGVCSFHPRNCQCIITLSMPLLKLRPRKDLVETLLHEMIHGYLFLTNNNRDRDGHDPEFHKHMYRINKEAGTNITVYHTFHDEVKLYQQHWWHCDGPCKNKAPYFGTVRRAMNRPPGPNDNWWHGHQQTCGGKFIKVREPDKKPSKSKKAANENGKKAANENGKKAANENGKKAANENGKKAAKVSKSKAISDWLTKPDQTKSSSSSDKSVTSETSAVPKAIPTTNKPSTFTKLGNSGNNIHGWGVAGPSDTPERSSRPVGTARGVKSPKFHASGVLGGSGTGRSNLLDKFASGGSKPKNDKKGNVVDLTESPSNKRKSEGLGETVSKMAKHDGRILENPKCPVCDKAVRIYEFNRHLHQCLMCESVGDSNQTTRHSGEQFDAPQVGSGVDVDSDDSKGSESQSVTDGRQKCLVCDNFIRSGMTLNEHLESCIEAAFMDESVIELEENDENRDSNDTSVKKFPCPICMTLIGETSMNQHLDTCLSADLLKNYIE